LRYRILSSQPFLSTQKDCREYRGSPLSSTTLKTFAEARGVGMMECFLSCVPCKAASTGREFLAREKVIAFMDAAFGTKLA
jgi:hypothetical protein